MNDWTGVVLAAGQGTRMKSSLPKVLHTVCGKPLLAHVADTMRSAGASKLVIVGSPAFADMLEFRAAAGEGTAIAIQQKPLGTANALESAKEAVGSARTVVVGAGDMALVRTETVQKLVEEHERSKALITVLTATVPDPTGLGRIVRTKDGKVSAIVEEAEADEIQKLIYEINTGMYCIDAAWAWAELEKVRVSAVGENYLTDLLAVGALQGRAAAIPVSHVSEGMGINNRVQLAEVEAVMRDQTRRAHMLAGVTIRDPQTTYIDAGVEIGQDTELLPGNHLHAGTRIGSGCIIGPNSILRDCEIGDGAKIISSHIDGAVIGAGISVGPFTRIRAGTRIETGAYIGNFAEIKNSNIGSGTHVGHFSYVGDSDLGKNVNIGAGTVTANYDGVNKHRTVIKDGVKVGSDTVIVAPVTIGENASTGSGSVVNRDVPAGETVVGVPARPISHRRSAGKNQEGDR